MTGLLSKSFFTLGLIGGLHWVDILIIAAYLSLLVGIGAYFSAKQSSVEEFMRGGAGKFGWLALGFSLMAALNSGGDYVQTPAVVYGIGMVFSMGFLSWVIDRLPERSAQYVCLGRPRCRCAMLHPSPRRAPACWPARGRRTAHFRHRIRCRCL